MRASTYTEKTLKSRKWPIIIAAAAAALADIFVITALGVGGFEPVYFVIPALLLALDAAFIWAWCSAATQAPVLPSQRRQWRFGWFCILLRWLSL